MGFNLVFKGLNSAGEELDIWIKNGNFQVAFT